jgi:hypothetical protein
VVQEVILAKCIYILCGDIQLSGRTYANFINYYRLIIVKYRLLYYQSGQSAVRLGDGGNAECIFGTGFQRILSRLRSQANADRSSTLQSLVEDFGDCRCSEKRDRIYGLLGLTTSLTNHSSPQNLPVDYSIPLEMLFFEVLKYCKPRERGRFSEHLMTVLELDKRYELHPEEA